MRRIEFSVEVESSTLAVAQISDILGYPASQGSKRAGDPAINGVWSGTLWRSATTALQGPSLGTLLSSLTAHPAYVALRQHRSELGDAVAVVNVAVYYTTMCCTVDLPDDLLRELGGSATRLVVACYPCETLG